jgi:uncharacterized protein YjiS (DUF1127 family)
MLEFVGMAATAGRYIASIWRAAAERKALNVFQHMDERLLRDIGFTRVDSVDSFTAQMRPFGGLMERRDDSLRPERAANDAAPQDRKSPASLAA